MAVYTSFVPNYLEAIQLLNDSVTIHCNSLPPTFLAAWGSWRGLFAAPAGGMQRCQGIRAAPILPFLVFPIKASAIIPTCSAAHHDPLVLAQSLVHLLISRNWIGGDSTATSLPWGFQCSYLLANDKYLAIVSLGPAEVARVVAKRKLVTIKDYKNYKISIFY